MAWPFESLCIFYILYATKTGFPIDFHAIQDSRIKQVFAWVRVHILCEWFATLVSIPHALRFQILHISTKTPGATLNESVRHLGTLLGTLRPPHRVI